MLVIRMQRTGRKGHAMFRLVVQDSRRTPTSGKVVAQLGSYDPHSKVVTLNVEKAQTYLDHGAQPSERAAMVLKKEGVKLPKWVTTSDKKAGKLRNPDKLRRNQPATEPEPEAVVETASSEVAEPADTSEIPETPDSPEEQAAA